MLQERKTEVAAAMKWADYRALNRDSYSTISQFQKDRKAYYKKYVLKEQIEEKPNPYYVYGSLLDCLLFTREEFAERFFVNTAQEPAPQMAEFTRNLAKRIIQNAATPTRESIRALFQYAYTDTKYGKDNEEVAFKKQTLEKTVERFFKECKGYLRILLTKEIGLDIISVFDYDRASYCCQSLQQHKVIGPLVTQTTDERFIVIKQLVVLYEINGMAMKSMLDLVIVDTLLKKVYFYDLKTSHNVEEFHISFVHFNYYIQLGCYTIAILIWMKQQGYADFELVPMRFIVVDNNNYMAPLLYFTEVQDVTSCLLGFYFGGKWHDGVLKLINDLQWHLRSGIWHTSADHYRNNSVVKLDFARKALVDLESDHLPT